MPMDIANLCIVDKDTSLTSLPDDKPCCDVNSSRGRYVLRPKADNAPERSKRIICIYLHANQTPTLFRGIVHFGR
jgi:hypothetical protein